MPACTGSLVKENPAIDVFVHERGATHLADPTKLLSSATRLYGQDMDRLWGEFLAVPRERLRELKGGETIAAGGRTLEVAYTPGHASHHVSYFEPSTRIAFVGDTAGIRRGTGKYVMPASPPPDVDLELWRESEAKILGWDPDTLFLTHFGPFNGARQHFQEMMSRLDEWSRTARRSRGRRASDRRGAGGAIRRRRASGFEADSRCRRRGTVQPRREHLVFVARSGALLAEAGGLTVASLPVSSSSHEVIGRASGNWQLATGNSHCDWQRRWWGRHEQIIRARTGSRVAHTLSARLRHKSPCSRLRRRPSRPRTSRGTRAAVR